MSGELILLNRFWSLWQQFKDDGYLSRDEEREFMHLGRGWKALHLRLSNRVQAEQVDKKMKRVQRKCQLHHQIADRRQANVKDVGNLKENAKPFTEGLWL